MKERVCKQVVINSTKWARTNIVLFTCEISELETPFGARFSVARSTRLKEAKPAIHELFRIFAGCAKVDQFNLQPIQTMVRMKFLKKRDSALKKKIRTWHVFVFHKKFVQFGSVCMTLNSN